MYSTEIIDTFRIELQKDSMYMVFTNFSGTAGSVSVSINGEYGTHSNSTDCLVSSHSTDPSSTQNFLITATRTENYTIIFHKANGASGDIDVKVSEVVTYALSAFSVTILATIYPAWRASRTLPAEALRYE